MVQLSFFKQLDLSLPPSKQITDSRKIRGGYYTPIELAQYLIQWGIRSDTQFILEPSCGDGNFLVAILQHLSQSFSHFSPEITAVELISDELNKAKTRVNQVNNNYHIDWMCEDFFESYGYLKQHKKFDLILGNPPFIRFQHFDEESRNTAFSYLREAGYKPTKLANAWAAFVQLSIELLAEDGRLAMVVPAELLQVKYAHELRNRLAAQFNHIIIIGFKKLVFPEIQQEVILLLAEGKREKSHLISDIHTIEFRDREELLQLNSLTDKVAHTPTKHARVGMKWTSLFLDNATFSALDEAEKATNLNPLGKFAEIDVGIVTGRNKFFIITNEQQEKLQCENLTIPIIGKTSALKMLDFTLEDFTTYTTQFPSFLLNLNGVKTQSFPQSIQEYLSSGEADNINKGYKCRIRKRWFDVPSIYIPDGFLFRQIHRYPLLVVNKAKVCSTDTIHRVRVKDGVKIELLAATFFNSLTLAWSEVCGRSYGGGVLELEPREAEELPIFYQDNIVLDIEKIDELLRRDQVYEALDYADSIILKHHLGFDQSMILNIRHAWEQLRDRRIKRK